MEKVKKIVIDARPLSRNTGGISRYLNMIVPYLENTEEYSFIFYTDYPITEKIFSGIKKVKVRSIAFNSRASFFWPFFVMLWMKYDKPDVFWSPRHHLPLYVRKKTKCLLTIHDLVWKVCPQTMPNAQLLVERLFMPLAVARADKIICVSNTTRKRLINFFPGSANKSITIYSGGNIEARELEIVNKPKKENFFLSVGTLEPRKNYVNMIEAFGLYASNGGVNDLVIVGKRGWGFKPIYNVLRKSKYRKRIKILNRASDQELARLYGVAQGFISTSIDEGFGLPLLEASEEGLPLCVSDIDVFRELYPHAKIWLDPNSLKNISTKMLEFDAVAANSKLRVQEFNGHTWSKSAKSHRQEIEKLLGI